MFSNAGVSSGANKSESLLRIMGKQRTPLTIRVPTLVIVPFKLSDRGEDITRVEPGSTGASNA